MSLQTKLFKLLSETKRAETKVNNTNYLCNVCEEFNCPLLHEVILQIMMDEDYKRRIVDHPHTGKRQYAYHDPRYRKVQSVGTVGFAEVRVTLLQEIRRQTVLLLSKPRTT